MRASRAVGPISRLDIAGQVPGRLDIGGGRLAHLDPAVVADEVAGDAEHHVALQMLVVIHEDLGNTESG
jgi:hypothetical protein